jgi:hypothetical protein
MISPEDIRARASKLWASGRALRAWLGAEALFPCAIAFARPTAKAWLTEFTALRDAVERLEASSKARTGAGYTLVMKETAHQKLGAMRIPERIAFETIEDLAAAAGQTGALRRFRAIAELLRSREPRLLEWLAAHPMHALELEAELPRLLAVIDHFQANPRPMRFARELGIPGVDSKFVEAYRGVLAEWLDRVMSADAIDGAARGLADSGFERRFGLRHEEPAIRIRWLDPTMAIAGAILDAAIPLSQLAAYTPACARVLVTENKINFLTLPYAERTLAIFGEGYGIERLAAIPWLREVPVHYWGDIDTHGFAILDRLRASLPHAQSLLMDRDTLVDHRELWSRETPEYRCLRELPGLNTEESALYDDLREDRLGECVRLEQERIHYPRVANALHLLKHRQKID